MKENKLVEISKTFAVRIIELDRSIKARGGNNAIVNQILRSGTSIEANIHEANYAATLGFDATNDIFAENAWYFRNALVRANYNDLKNGIHETTEYLELFLRNLLLDEKHELHNRAMHISGVFEKKVDIESAKVDIQNKMISYSNTLSEKTINHAIDIYIYCL